MVRQRRSKVEAEKDVAWLRWLGRYRFVTAELAGLRFGVSEQQARLRLRRLADAGLVSLHRSHLAEPYLAVLTTRGAAHIGYPRRARQPRPDLHREHELAIVRFALPLEREDQEAVLTERDGRRLEAAGEGRYSVDVVDDRGRSGQRWPDLVLLTPKGRVAIELEFAPKHTDRLRRIVRGYLASELAAVEFIVAQPALAARLLKTAAHERAALLSGLADRLPAVHIRPWDGAPEADRRRIAALTA